MEKVDHVYRQWANSSYDWDTPFYLDVSDYFLAATLG